MNFTVIWFNPDKNIYDNFYTPTNYLQLNKVRLLKNNNYIDTEISLSQLHSYNNGYDLVDNIFTDEKLINWIKHTNVIDFSKHKEIVDKVAIK